MYFGGAVAIVIMIAIAIARLVYSHKKYNKKMKAETSDDLFRQIVASKDKKETWSLLCQHIADNQSLYLTFVIDTYTQITDGFVNDDLRTLRRADSALRTEKGALKKMRRKEMVGLQRIDKDIAIEKNTWFHLGSNSCQQIMYCLRRICEPCEEHVDNNFKPMPMELVKEFIPLRDTLVYLLKRTHTVISEGKYNPRRMRPPEGIAFTHPQVADEPHAGCEKQPCRLLCLPEHPAGDPGARQLVAPPAACNPPFPDQRIRCLM